MVNYRLWVLRKGFAGKATHHTKAFWVIQVFRGSPCNSFLCTIEPPLIDIRGVLCVVYFVVFDLLCEIFCFLYYCYSRGRPRAGSSPAYPTLEVV